LKMRFGGEKRTRVTVETYGLSRRDRAPLIFVETSRVNRPEEAFFLVVSPIDEGQELFVKAIAEYKRGTDIRTPEDYMSFLRETALSVQSAQIELHADEKEPDGAADTQSGKLEVAGPFRAQTPSVESAGSGFRSPLWYGAAWLRGETCHWLTGGRFLMARVSKEEHVFRIPGESGKVDLGHGEKLVASRRAEFDEIEERLREGENKGDLKTILRSLSDENRVTGAVVMETGVPSRQKAEKARRRRAERLLGTQSGMPPSGGRSRPLIGWLFVVLAVVVVVVMAVKRPWSSGPPTPGMEEVADPKEVSPVALESDTENVQSAGARLEQVSLAKLWSKKYEGAVTSSPQVSGGRVYFGCRDGNLYCLDAETGKEHWKFRSGSGMGASPCLDGTRLYIGAYDGSFYCLDRGSGRALWRFSAGGRIVSSASTASGSVVFGSYDRNLYCLSTQSGSLRWKIETGGLIWSSPLIQGESCYFGSADGTFYSVELASGEVKWKRSLGSPIYSSPGGTASSICVGTNADGILFLSLETGREVRRVATGREVRGTILVDQETIYAGADDGAVRCIRGRDGSIAWSARTGAAVRSGPALYRGIVFVTSYDGRLHAIDSASGKEVAVFSAGSQIYSSPAVAEGRIYFGTNNGDFLCLGISEP
jgi:outer membrane protein assembly factor BamB